MAVTGSKIFVQDISSKNLTFARNTILPQRLTEDFNTKAHSLSDTKCKVVIWFSRFTAYAGNTFLACSVSITPRGWESLKLHSKTLECTYVPSIDYEEN